MTDLLQYKSEYLNQRTQFILFNRSGNVVDSCHTILDLKDKGSVFELFPILDTVRQSIDTLLTPNAELHFPIVEQQFEGKDYIFDFRIRSWDGNGSPTETFLWILLDHTESCFDLIRLKRELNREKFLLDKARHNVA